MRLLVTGGAGFIGSHFVDFVLSETSPLGSVELIVIDKLTYAGNLRNLQPHEDDPRFQFIEADICHFPSVVEACKGVDVLVNFAAESHVDRSISDSDEFIRTNILGLSNLLNAAKDNAVGKFVQISTDEVYGSILYGSWDETWPVSPNSPYSASKASADLLVQSFYKTHGLNTNITRCSNNYGYRQYPEKLIPLFVQLLAEGKQVPVYGNGLNIREWIHVSDHVRGIIEVIKFGLPGEIYNIAGGIEITNLELTKLILREFSLDEQNISWVEDRKGHDLRYSLNGDKLKSLSGFTSQVDFSEGLQETIKWFRENPHWFEN